MNACWLWAAGSPNAGASAHRSKAVAGKSGAPVGARQPGVRRIVCAHRGVRRGMPAGRWTHVPTVIYSKKPTGEWYIRFRGGQMPVLTCIRAAALVGVN